MRESKLAPCQWCGNPPTLKPWQDGGVCMIHSGKCDFVKPTLFFDSEKEAVEAWNAQYASGGVIKGHEHWNAHLLEHFRQCGEFKCTECLYSLCKQTHLGEMYDCKHPGTLLHKGYKDRDEVMRSCACFWFVPMANAGQYVARRNAKQRDVWRKVLDYAERHTNWTATGESNDEKQLLRLKRELRELGVMGV